ncbi:ALC-interacting protein 1 [Citrus sinensis]|uniref:DUF3741 domain-containing protein n=1 Tax=Citrus sinensis TaxID=2711 RepID=A0A067ENJ8_CITSI|nr:uncharacterized protein LOC102611497 isoform X1 [Citrus sinensis]KAH9672995.1 ALC-interacting protein 1 [Citrus sinensis]KDO56663.1 hypothetical protein CISIN_1g014888mg [Citrus sinensis]
MADSIQSADSGCFKGLLRRLLCRGSLQTHPSDQIIPEPKEPDEFNEQKPEAKIEASGAPGLVARLMGLDSLPEAKSVPKGRAPESVTRSRSVNFMEYLLELHVAQAHQHRRVRTSVSFREVPTMSRQQNQDSFVLYLGKEDERNMGLKVRKGKASVDSGGMKKKKEEKIKSKKKENEGTSKKVSKFIDEPRRVSVKRSAKIKNCKGAKDFGVVLPAKNCGNKEPEAALKTRKKGPVMPMHQKEVPTRGKISNKSKHQLVIEEVKPAECSSENSSPVSVLDVSDFSIFDDTQLSDEKRCMELNSKSLHSLMTANCDYPSSCSARTLSYHDLDQLRVIKKKENESMDNQMVDYYAELATKIHKVTEEAILQSNWVPEKVLNFEDLEELCMELGQHILAILLQQMIAELVGSNTDVCAL